MSTPWIIAFVVLAVAVAITLITVIGTLRRITAALLRAEDAIRASTASAPLVSGAEPGTTLPSFALSDRDGKLVHSEELTEKRSIFLFVEDHCAPCRNLVAEIEDGHLSLGVPVYLIYHDADQKHDLPVLREAVPMFQANRAVSNAFQTFISPQAFLVQQGRVVGHSLPSRADDLQALSTQSEEVRPSRTQAA